MFGLAFGLASLRDCLLDAREKSFRLNVLRQIFLEQASISSIISRGIVFESPNGGILTRKIPVGV
jgi:hypothetical protein